jgi:hypothetical protein
MLQFIVMWFALASHQVSMIWKSHTKTVLLHGIEGFEKPAHPTVRDPIAESLPFDGYDKVGYPFCQVVMRSVTDGFSPRALILHPSLRENP